MLRISIDARSLIQNGPFLQSLQQNIVQNKMKKFPLMLEGYGVGADWAAQE